MITRIKKQRLEAIKRQAQTRKHRHFESDEVIVTAQEIVDAFFLGTVCLCRIGV